MSGLVLSELERLAALEEAERTFPMTEEEFRAFYELTSRPVWVYLTRMTGDSRLADDLLQEAYYRLLRTKATFESDDHRRNYLYRIATNLVHDHRRRPRADREPLEDPERQPAPASLTGSESRAARRIDLARAMARMKPRERSMLWLAYAHGCSHEEIAQVLGLKTSSLKALLHRARRRLAGFLTPAGDGGTP
ncbi:MAG TPA: sigma-70 family RNA polymerase sigma factor [Vicinamibacterales bacterium]|jgi:RNA polymerase sigma-70 factor (ECF subfamily)|nr:sigma-70 family RNA polymerase sigma factor [Vicinamibacterales bacterium]